MSRTRTPWLLVGFFIAAGTLRLAPADTLAEAQIQPAAQAQARPQANKPAPPSASGAKPKSISLSAAVEKDPILRAMRDELDRVPLLRIASVNPPYYARISLYDAEAVAIGASLGALIASDRTNYRLGETQVRTGDYDLDNTNYIGGLFRGSGISRLVGFPIDNDYLAMRHRLWLSLDDAFKSAAEILSRKKAVLQSVTVTEELPDFGRTQPNQLLRYTQLSPIDQEAWKRRVKELSAIFRDFPEIQASSVDFQVSTSNTYFADSEGTVIRNPERLMYLRARAEAQAQDGATLRNWAFAVALDSQSLPNDAELAAIVRTAAQQLDDLRKAPQEESYVGPVLFEGDAAAQLFAQLVGKNLLLPRRPIADPGRNVPFQPSPLEARLESRILPDWIDITDDPTLHEWQGKPLVGHYETDLEGVSAQPVHVVQKGVLKGFLLTRQPVKTFRQSNGHARLPGFLGNFQAGMSNLVVASQETVSSAELKKKLIEMVQARNKPYGILLRKLDFPSTAPMAELRETAARTSQSGGQVVSSPLLAYRVYPDGREELVRGLQFRGLSVRALRDIVAASRETTIFHFLDNNAPLAMAGTQGVNAETSIIAPSVLFEEIEMEKQTGELPNLPIVPPPPLTPAAPAR
jgi:TldD protein